MIKVSKNFVILGSNGAIGKPLSEYLDGESVFKTSRTEIQSWLNDSMQERLDNYFRIFDPDTTVICALGLTDPNSPIEKLKLLNCTLPIQLLETVNKYGLNLITFGSILESHSRIARSNSYLKTKNDFYNLLGQFPVSSRHLHLQLHTIYGGVRSHPHMFIEQIFQSIRDNTPFNMSSGMQIREYHHIQDEVEAIFSLIFDKLTGIHQLNAGNAIPIKDLATRIFKEFGMMQLLNINSSTIADDVFDKFYEKTPELELVNFREPISGVIEYLTSKLGSLSGDPR